ncbi:Kunitz/Bovine pancreatic trypsin inhibitor domain protein [Ancylostoma caninum]|uniref:Kunitz/Bovine pancreatic trypsin inhibitor domain protein n=1 Tax=Ancylostoma caninum TaxID=29170 RepID=A0A368H241_ANCCA|nr:Kunitz/Bovine pancreatic trypsin inhibitor domain protein [Ancylostoma caninum]
MWQLLLLVAVPLQTQGIELRSPCNESVHLGDSNCEKAPSIRYHLDAKTLTCLPFKYSGCGGNGNNFESSARCQIKCLPMDYLMCPANTPPVKRNDGTSHCDEEIKCPKGSTCRRGFVVGLCCDDKVIERYNANQKPDCGNKKLVTDKTLGYPAVLFGKSCDHNFCPEGSDCRHGHFFAYCCKS